MLGTCDAALGAGAWCLPHPPTTSPPAASAPFRCQPTPPAAQALLDPSPSRRTLRSDIRRGEVTSSCTALTTEAACDAAGAACEWQRGRGCATQDMCSWLGEADCAAATLPDGGKVRRVLGQAAGVGVLRGVGACVLGGSCRRLRNSLQPRPAPGRPAASAKHPSSPSHTHAGLRLRPSPRLQPSAHAGAARCWRAAGSWRRGRTVPALHAASPAADTRVSAVPIAKRGQLVT